MDLPRDFEIVVGRKGMRANLPQLIVWMNISAIRDALPTSVIEVG